jgi:hypothetical protein
MGIVGFVHVDTQWHWQILVVKGVRCYNIPVPYSVYKIIHYFWVRKTEKNRKLLLKTLDK